MFNNIVKFISIIFLLFLLTTRLGLSEIVKKIEIDGNERIPIETINMLSGIKINDNINENDINNLLKNLYETNFFKNLEIKLDNGILKISVLENPIISEINIKGIKAKRIKESINNVLSIREKSSFNEIRLLEEQEKILDKASSKAVDQVIKERKSKRRNLIKEWFRFAELVSKQIRKYLS